ncbi:MAG: lipoate--protein ligase [Aquificaceae bacterium]|nr:lipoate--protein ligase [Aquificaceae bacterium]MDW8433503.1 lipoate--protein ligase [Aquificaceae bacterium]
MQRKYRSKKEELHSSDHFAHTVELLSGAESMKRDFENLIKAEECGEVSFRLYQWKETTLSIGYSQEAISVSIPTVKRPTGGGALLHGEDLSFSFAGLREDWGKNSKNIYKNFMSLVLDVLKNLVPELDMSRYKGGYDDYFCYFYPTLGEITFKGKKVIACAMRVMKHSFLIHGSVFLSMSYQNFERLLGISAERLKERIITFKELGVDAVELKKSMMEVEKRLTL